LALLEKEYTDAGHGIGDESGLNTSRALQSGYEPLNLILLVSRSMQFTIMFV
jgi:hypothetical protein